MAITAEIILFWTFVPEPVLVRDFLGGLPAPESGVAREPLLPFLPGKERCGELPASASQQSELPSFRCVTHSLHAGRSWVSIVLFRLTELG